MAAFPRYLTAAPLKHREDALSDAERCFLSAVSHRGPIEAVSVSPSAVRAQSLSAVSHRGPIEAAAVLRTRFPALSFPRYLTAAPLKLPFANLGYTPGGSFPRYLTAAPLKLGLVLRFAKVGGVPFRGISPRPH